MQECIGLEMRCLCTLQVHMGLQHPHIVQLLEFFEDSDRVYLVMELCSRGELLSLVQQKVAACLSRLLQWC